MALGVCIRRLSFDLKQSIQSLANRAAQDCRSLSSTVAIPEHTTETKKSDSLEQPQLQNRSTVVPLECRFIYPEFLPDPAIDKRNKIREKLERIDMLNRRAHVDIPEFYVGSIMAVTSSDPHSQGKISRFVGICISRRGCGLRANFILRNVVDSQGMEILYELYNPTIHKIEVLRLEKRLDDELFYLRDALPEYSTFSFDMDPEIHSEGTPVVVNTLKVKLRPRPWLERWERQDLQGVQDLGLPNRFYKRAEQLAMPWEKYDLMKQYRSTIPEEEQKEIFSEVYSELHQLEHTKKKMKRKRTFVKPKKTG